MHVLDQSQFLAHRKTQEQAHHDQADHGDPLSSILSVEINTTELCNRTCVFCPRHDPRVFPNRDLHMSPAGADIIASKLSGAYQGRISFSGFGENLLNPEFPGVIEKFRKNLPGNFLECNTNGDRLTRDLARRLFDSGLDMLYINLYDGEHQIEGFESMLSGQAGIGEYRYRQHWNPDDHGLILNNRSGTIQWISQTHTVENLQKSRCYYPFYKMFVDWNGDVLFCSNDWGREHVVGNLMNQSLAGVWLGRPMKKIRARLAQGDRSHSPCDQCSVSGTLFGEKSFDILQAYENHQDNR